MSRLLGFDFEVKRAGSAAEYSALRFRLETHEARTAGGDADCGWIEVPVDATGGIDQANTAAGEAVAVVLDHELVAGPVSRPDHRLQRNDPSVVERLDVECRFCRDGFVGVVRRDDADADDGGPGGRRWQLRRGDDDVDDFERAAEQRDVAPLDVHPVGDEPTRHDGVALGRVTEVLHRQLQRE